MNTSSKQVLFTLAALTCAFTLLPESAFAASNGMPWEAPLEKVLDSVTGPVARAMGAIVIVMSGMALTVGEASGGTRRLLWVGMGLSITFSAVSFFLGFLGFSSGAAF
jgi:type IV secretory pathway VirB2 component (pilin)